MAQLERNAVGLREVVFQSICCMAPAAAIAASIPFGSPLAGGALPLAVVFAFIGAVSVIVFQLKINQEPLEGDVEVPVTPPITALPQPQVDSSALAAVDSLPVQDTTGSAISELPAVATTSGTSIATKPKITRLTQKEGKTRYFLVIGSFGTEEETDRFIQKTGNKFAEYQLIYPYEGSTNYRLAVGVFNSWNEASNKLNELKAQQSNGYWILKF